MAGQHHVVGQDRAVADPVVVGHVHVGHQEAVGADHGGAPGPGGAVDRDALADQVAVADHEARLLPGKGHVLRLAAEHGALVDSVVRAECREAPQYRVRADLAAVADRRVVLDHGQRADHDVPADTSLRRDDGARVDAHARRIVAPASRIRVLSRRLTLAGGGP